MTGPARENSTGKRIKSTRTLFTIIDALLERESAGVSELAAELDMPKSTVHVHLKTLEAEGYLLKDAGEYRFSLRFLELGGEIRHRLDVFRAARSEVDDLSLETGELAHLGLEERGKRALVYSSGHGSGVFDNSPDGHYTHMHWTAMGKALLAQLPDDRVDSVLDRHGLPEATEHTITDRGRLFEELDEIRDRGYATEHDEHRNGLSTIAVATARDTTDEAPAGIGISGPTQRITEKNSDDDLVKAIRNAVNVVDLELKYY